MKILALFLLPFAVLASEHTYLIGGGNGKLSPDKKWYADLLDYKSKQNEIQYLEFTIYNLRENGIRNANSFTPKKEHLPYAKILIPLSFRSRAADFFWSEDSTEFTATFQNTVVYYNLETMALKVVPNE